MDETGQPGGAGSANSNGAGEHGEFVRDSSRLGSWAPASAQPQVHHNGSADPLGSEPIWSSVGAALEPVMDPLSAAWHGGLRGGYAEQPVQAPVPAGSVVTAEGPSPMLPPSLLSPSVFPPSGPPPASAPPYPYEGDLDEPEPLEYGRPEPDPWTQRQSAPLPPGHVSLGDVSLGDVSVRDAPDRAVSVRDASVGDVSPDDVTPPHGMPVVPQTTGGWREAEVLPQRIPAEPDVPAIPEGEAGDEVAAPAEVPELARIATYLKHDDAPPTREGFDVDEVLAAVREVAGVRGAELRRSPGRVHTLRLDLADGADPGQVSRAVARLLSERMGLSAAMDSPPAAPRSVVAAPSRAPSASTTPPPGAAATAPVPATAPAPPPGYRASADTAYQPRRRRAASGVRERAAADTRIAADDRMTCPPGPTAMPATGPERPGHPLPQRTDVARVVLDHVQVSTFGLDATVEVRLAVGERRALGEASGPAVDGYVLRLCAVSAAAAVDQLLIDDVTGRGRGRCFVEHASVVPFGSCEVAVVVVLLVCNGWVEQLAGSALVAGDPRQSVVRATLSAVNRRLESLLP